MKLQSHPDTINDEVFIGNVTLGDFNESAWTTKRTTGKERCLVYGNICYWYDMIPMFVSRKEMDGRRGKSRCIMQ